MWHYRGTKRPDFAVIPKEGQESVWDYPRPPRLVADARQVIVRAGDVLIAESQKALRVLETASPPTFYLPPDDVDVTRLVAAEGASFCEWKGRAAYWSVLGPNGEWLTKASWSYPRPTAAFAALLGWYSFYPSQLKCTVAGEIVRPQPGGFYGGWVTNEIVGPYKGEPGTGSW